MTPNFRVNKWNSFSGIWVCNYIRPEFPTIKNSIFTKTNEPQFTHGLTIQLSPGMQNLKDITPRELAPGLLAKIVHGIQTTLSIVEIKKGSKLPQHQHFHEQITYILKGQLDMVIGGEEYSLTEGSVHVIPPNVPHNAFAVTDCLVVDAFSPARDDYR